MTNEDRFARIATDPRFRRVSKNPKKKTPIVDGVASDAAAVDSSSRLQIDDRFKGVFTDPKFLKPYKVDRYGRKIEGEVQERAKKEMARFYRLEDEEQESVASDSAESTETTGSSESECEEAVSSAEFSSDSDSDASDVEDCLLEEVYAQHPLVNTSAIEQGDATHRLAVVNVDWDQICAVDLLVLFSAFKPPIGSILSVKIFPSEFGKERLAREAIEGPPRDIFSKPLTEVSSDSDDDPLADLKKAQVLGEEGGEFNQLALRRYQLERLRYYYAVIECDSVETAAAIYHHCDGREFETSTNTLDLRYIPDEVTFDQAALHDQATEVPKKYVPKPAMITDALQQSRVKLTWDADSQDRTRLTRRNPSKDDFEEADLRAYLASDSEEDTAAAEPADKISLYRAKLLSSGMKISSVFGRKSHADNDDLRITFTSGIMDEASDDQNDAETAEIRELEEQMDLDSNDEGDRVAVFDEDGNLVTKIDDESVASTEKKASSKKSDSAKFILQKDWRSASEKDANGTKTKKRKMSRKRVVDEDSEAFKVDLQDDRFKAVFDSADYAIDPSTAGFRATPGIQAIIAERQKRRRVADTERENTRSSHN